MQNLDAVLQTGGIWTENAQKLTNIPKPDFSRPVRGVSSQTSPSLFFSLQLPRKPRAASSYRRGRMEKTSLAWQRPETKWHPTGEVARTADAGLRQAAALAAAGDEHDGRPGRATRARQSTVSEGSGHGQERFSLAKIYPGVRLG